MSSVDADIIRYLSMDRSLPHRVYEYAQCYPNRGYSH
jgi:hypothetical protein